MPTSRSGDFFSARYTGSTRSIAGYCSESLDSTRCRSPESSELRENDNDNKKLGNSRCIVGFGCP